MDWGERWRRLFDDLEAALESDLRREWDAEVADRTRRERAGVDLAGRLLAHRGHDLELGLVAGIRVHGRLLDVGADWVTMAPSAHRAALVPRAAVVSVAGLGRASAPTGSARRFGLGYALREISRDRRRVQIFDVAGSSVEGTIDVVGADFVDVSEHPRDEPRRPGNVRGSRTLPFAALACVHSGG